MEKKRQEAKASDCTSVKITVCSAETVLFSALTVTDKPPSIYIILCNPNLIRRRCKNMLRTTGAELLYTNVSHSMTRGTALISHRELHKENSL